MNIYMDYNARVPLLPEAAAAMRNAFDYYANPSSPHRAGRDARALIEKARAEIAQLCGAESHNVIFTSSGSEANALAMQIASEWFVSAIEHVSVVKNAPTIKALLPVDQQGVVIVEQVAQIIAQHDRPHLSVLYANNETGVIQPIREIAALVQQAGGFIHCDAVQAAGKLPLDINDLNVDALTLSAHKIGGPPGVGALVLAHPCSFTPLIKGGAQEFGQRAGTENLIAIAGFAAAAKIAPKMMGQNQQLTQQLTKWRDQLEAALPEQAVIFGQKALRLANTSCFALPEFTSEKSLILFDLAGIQLSAGAACSSGKISASEVLLAQQVAPHIARSALRVSLGWQTRAQHIQYFVETLQAICAKQAA